MDRLTTIDVHVGGEPLRVVSGGYPEPQGSTILEKRDYCRQHLDHLRRTLMLEPRGHAHMYGALPVDTSRSDADIGVLFFHNEGYSTMCGHGIIGLTTVLLNSDCSTTNQYDNPLRIDTPSGVVTATAQKSHERILSVTFQNIPSFVEELDRCVDVPGFGPVRYDLAFGGAYYAFCRAEELQLDLTQPHIRSLTDFGMAIKRAIMSTYPITHPTDERLGFLYGVIFVGPAQQEGAFCRQVCIFADGAMDRSPTGTGVSAHLAILAARRTISPDTSYRMESILGTTFEGTVATDVEYEGRSAIIPEVSGEAYITGKHQFLIDPDDPLKTGFRLD